MGQHNYRRTGCKVETVRAIELPALGDPLENLEAPTLREIRQRCGYETASSCKTCNHPQRDEIEQAVMTESVRQVAKRYGLSRTGLLNHMRQHFAVPE